jgi:asparagine synthase (glutamine-hydrolysing)
MNHLMVARGPDDEGVYVDKAAGTALGARRLSILDVEGGHQPLCNEDGTVWAVLNGEIYNYPALRRHLVQRGHELSTHTDTEALVHLYEDYGPDLVHALDGMFAFAIWDSKRRQLTLARDRFGEKPLFYCRGDGYLAFASELNALRAGTGLDADIDPGALDSYFVLGYVPGPETMLRGAQQLPPGALLVWRHGEPLAAPRSYWRPPVSRDAQGENVDDELIAELEWLFDQSVGRRLLSDVPVGVFLSGGTDSMLVAAFAARHSSEPIKTFTVDYDVGSVGEADTARQVAAQLGSEHHELLLRSEEVREQVPHLLAGLDQPLADQALVALYAVSRFARPDITVALGGEGADELFGGYPRYRWLARSERLQQTVPPRAADIARRALELAPKTAQIQRLATVVSTEPIMERHLAWVTFGRREIRESVYGPLMRAALDDSQPEEPFLDSRDGSPVSALIRQDLAGWLPDDVLAKADRASMRSSLEMRTPYLSRELAEFALALPPRIHLGGSGKRLLRRLLAKAVPAETSRRPKRAFQVPSSEWLRGPLKGALRGQLERGDMFSEGWFDRAGVSRLYEEHMTGACDRSAALWPLLAFGLWLDRLRGDDAA